MRYLVNPASALVLLSGLFFATLAGASPLADDVVRASPLGAIADQSRAMLRQGVRDGLERTGQVEPFIADTIASLSSQAFSGESIRARLVQDLDQQLDDDQLRQVRDWYQTPLGRRVTEAEVAAAEPRSWERVAADTGQEEDESRMALFERYDRASRATESTVSIAMAVQLGLVETMAALKGNDASADELRDRVRAHRPIVEEQVGQQVSTAFSRIYEPFSDKELEQYLDFLESPAGRAFTATATDSIQDAIMEPVESIGTQLARLLGAKRQ